jgi:hypothetical protein
MTPEQELQAGLADWQKKQIEEGKAEFGFDPASGKATIVQKQETPSESGKKWWQFWK